ncbi:hypothetical protein GPECTOR_1g141 [Gonium pectorale]|uniref:Protein kinase domain-containing protein n=1 Tax=Gonium pectorale TaxID=33097 RepID=A0A150H281_GONPE|nr:hypothetical protein GPECTOR_1g141 [Gonium pectorale]|eukprot:KXZ56165.1 hypothetical protein GPECTOR_1g141 [Gonium pectorale]
MPQACEDLRGSEGDARVIAGPGFPSDCGSCRTGILSAIGCGTERPSLIELLADVTELSTLAPSGPYGSVWEGTWRGCKVVVKLSSFPQWAPDSPFLAAAAAAARLDHPNLLRVHQIRLASLDERNVDELESLLIRRAYWPPVLGPVARLQRLASSDMSPAVSCGLFGTASSSSGATSNVEGRQSRPASSASLARLALSGLPLAPGRSILATVAENCTLGNLRGLACSQDSPFRPGAARPLPAARGALLRTAREVASALAALHAAGVAHGSLRPSNVLLAASSDDPRGFEARVADAGSPSAANAASHPMSSGPCMLWLAPEALVEESKVVSPAADAYAFGLLLYLMAAGEMPFQGLGLVPTLMAVASGGLRPEWPTVHHSDLEPLFSRCINADPVQRPGFLEILEELDSLMRGAGHGGADGEAPEFADE